eukprot:7912789-Prorocentrum_lima.AAC.1
MRHQSAGDAPDAGSGDLDVDERRSTRVSQEAAFQLERENTRTFGAQSLSGLPPITLAICASTAASLGCEDGGRQHTRREGELCVPDRQWLRRGRTGLDST